MTASYDNHYQTEQLFGEPYPLLIDFFEGLPKRGKLLDLGCGQGRNAIALARLGYAVTGIDSSKVGIDQMSQIAGAENLDLIGHVGDIYAFDRFDAFDIVLMDSMFHFAKKDKDKEVGLIKKILSGLSAGSIVAVCIQDTGDKLHVLNQALDSEKRHNRLLDTPFKYVFNDSESEHTSETDYRIVVIEKA